MNYIDRYWSCWP